MDNLILLLSIVGSFASIYAFVQVIRDFIQKKEKKKAITDIAIFIIFTIFSTILIVYVNSSKSGSNEDLLVKQAIKLQELEQKFKEFKSENFDAISSEDIKIAEMSKYYYIEINLRQRQNIGKYISNDKKLKELVNQALKFLINRKPDVSKNDIEISVTGFADAMPILGQLKYRYELGKISNEEYFDENENMEKLSNIDEQTHLTNQDLAFLRAYNIKQLIDKDLVLKPNKIHIKTKVADTIGVSSRNVIIEMKVIK